MKLYISGPMSGLPEHNFPTFFAAEERLRKAGFETENPAEKGIIDGWTWEDYLRYDLVKMLQCDGIAVLSNWRQSKGAQLEVRTADAIKLPVRTVNTWLVRARVLGPVL